MKTSKKLLSLLLAVVLIVTSCSVGFTAFAADSKTDSNNSYWNDGTDADAAFDALNDLVDAYIPQLLNISAVKSLLEDNLGMTVTDTTTISDVVAGASPMLLSLLGGSADKSSIIPNYETASELYYSYLDGSDDDVMDFYSLYKFCSDNKGAAGDLGAYCKETYEKLNELLAVYENVELERSTNYSESQEAVYEIYDYIYETLYDDESYGGEPSAATISEIENIDYNGTLIKDLDIPECEWWIDYVSSLYTTFGDNIKINNLADAIYYSMADYGTYALIAQGYFSQLIAGGATVTTEPIGGDSSEVLTNGNYLKTLSKYFSFDDYVQQYCDERSYDYDEITAKIESDSAYKANITKDYNAYLELYLYLCCAPEDNGHSSFDSVDFNAMGAGVLISSEFYGNESETKQYIKDQEITREQMQAFSDYISANWDGVTAEYFTNYINSSNNVFSDAVTRYLKALSGNNSSFVGLTPFLRLGLNGDVDAMMDYVLEDGYEDQFEGMNLVERINYMVPSEILSLIFGGGYDIDGVLDATDVFSCLSAINDYKNFILPETSKYSYKYSDYTIPDELTVQAVNSELNSTLAGVFNNEMVTDIIDALLETNVSLYNSEGTGVLNDIWLNLYNDPVATIFNLLPTAAILIDELVAPLVINGEGDRYNAVGGSPVVYSLLCTGDGILTKYTQDTANALDLDTASESDIKNGKVGIGALTFDLNKILPAVLNWLIGNEDEAYDLVGHYTGDFYDNDVPVFTNIYAADKALYGAHLNGGLAKTLKKNGTASTTADGLDEIVTELATFALDAIDDYLADHSEDAKWTEDTTTQKGLNNIFVALPQVIDSMGKKFIEKYGIDSDWTYCYDGKITTITKTYKNVEYVQPINNTLQDFKDLATSNDPNAILENFVGIFVGNWVNGLLDLVNDTIQDGNNKITAKLPIVAGILQALGGFGEQSIITDVVNGLFQLKRSDVASFTLTQRDTGFVGFSNESGFFLISNLQFDEKGKSKGLIPFVLTLINQNDGKAKYSVSNVFRGAKVVSPLLSSSTSSSSSATSAAGTNYSELLTKENKAAAQSLIDTLDKLLSSLLANTSLNGFDWDSTDNILTSISTFAAAYFGSKNTNDIVKLINNYLFFVTGENNNTAAAGTIGTSATSSGDVDAKKVYTSANLSNLVIQTYSLVENIIDYLFYNSDSGFLVKRDPNMLVADALYGIISPDSVSVRLSSKYSKTAKILASEDYLNWNNFKVDITTDYKTKGTYTKDYLKYGFKNGDKDSFYDALAESLSGVTAILGSLLTTTGYYENVVYPVINSIASANGVTGVMKPSAFNKASNADKLVKGLLTPISQILDKFYDAPVSMLLDTIRGISGVLDDKTLKSIVNGAIKPLNNELNGLIKIVKYLSPTFASSLKKSIGKGISVSLPNKNVLVTLVNKLLGQISVGDGKLTDYVKLPNINWNKIATAKDASETFLLIFGYIGDTLIHSDLITNLLGVSIDGSVTDILKLLNQILSIVKSPTELYWSFSEYSSKLSSSFSYPSGITASDADSAVTQIDELVTNVFPLLNSLGVTDIEGLSEIVNDNLYTNKNLTSLTTALYGALDGNDTIAKVLDTVGVDVSPSGVAKYLTDSSYGRTYSSAASQLKKAKSWSDIKSLNWGFTDGTSNAKSGFVNGIAAALRPINKVLAVFLAEGDIDLGNLDIRGLVKTLSTKGSTNLGSGEYGCTLTYSLKNSIFKITVQSNVKNKNSDIKNVFKIDIDEVLKTLESMLDENGKLYLGTNGYENAIIPILEAFMCDNVKTYAQYKSDYSKAKDNLLLDILNPIVGLVDDVLDSPLTTLTTILPNVAYFIDSNGIMQAVGNLLGAITSEKGLLGVLKKNGLDVDELIEAIAGDDLGSVVTNALGINVDLNLELTNLKACNIQDIVVPLVNKLLKSNNINITIPSINFATIASHGTVKTVTSAAKNTQGSYTTLQVQSNKGETFIAVLRYLSKLISTNGSALKSIICNIDAVKKNSKISNLVASIFDQLSTISEDEIVLALFYFLNGETTNTFFDYTNFTYSDDYKFSFGDMDEDFCRQLAPMLDGLVGGLVDLNSLVTEKVYTDDIISKIATGLYGAVEGVEVGDGTLTELLAQTDIDFSTSNVASLLVNEDYGQTYQAAAAVISSAGSWSNVNADNLIWGVKDRDSFLHALCAVLRPIYGVLDVLLNDGSLNLFNLISVPGSDGYTSFLVPLLEAFGVYNIKTQYQYREDIFEAYDNILLDVLNPLLDKVEDLLSAPIETLANILPNLSLFFANNGLLQLIENLLTPVSAILDAVKPIVNVNDVLDALGLDVSALLAKAGLNINVDLDVYDLSGTLEPLIGSDNVVSLLNSILGIIKISGTPLGIELPDIDWFQLASHGEVILDGTSQVASYGKRIYVESDEDETLIAVLRYLINTINYNDNYSAIVDLVGGLLGSANDTVSDVVGQVLDMLQGDADEVIASLVDLLQTLA